MGPTGAHVSAGQQGGKSQVWVRLRCHTGQAGKERVHFYLNRDRVNIINPLKKTLFTAITQEYKIYKRKYPFLICGGLWSRQPVVKSIL